MSSLIILGVALMILAAFSLFVNFGVYFFLTTNIVGLILIACGLMMRGEDAK